MGNIINKNRDTFIASLLIILLFTFVAVLWVGKGTFSSDPTTYDNVLLHCPESADGSSNIACNITANFKTVTGLSVNANYKLPDGVSFVSFDVSSECVDNCFEVYANTENGFAVANTDGLTGNHLIGKVVFKLPDNVNGNDVYKIGLTNVEFSDSEYNMHQLDDVSVDVRIFSDIATLDSLKVNNGEVELSPSFSSDILEYKANVSSDIDKVNVSAILTDKNNETLEPRGNITGDIGELNLHYGTNDFEIIVTAEDGNTISTYKLSIYREYEFEYDGVYSYNKANNYLYTKNDIDKDTIITNLGILDNDLTYDMNDDNTELYIKFIDEVLLEIDIINFRVDNQIVDNQIYVKDLTINELLDTISKNKVDIKIVDDDGLEVTSGNIIDSYKFNVYYNGTLLDSYSFKLEYLKISDSIIVDDQNKIFNRLVIGTTYAEIKEMIDTNGEISIISHDGLEITDESVVRTGDKVKIKFSNDEIVYTLSVLGDLNGDGIVTVGDVSIVYRYVKGRIELDTIFVNSANIINDDGVTVGDVSRLYRYLRNRVPTLEVIE